MFYLFLWVLINLIPTPVSLLLDGEGVKPWAVKGFLPAKVRSPEIFPNSKGENPSDCQTGVYTGYD